MKEMRAECRTMRSMKVSQQEISRIAFSLLDRSIKKRRRKIDKISFQEIMEPWTDQHGLWSSLKISFDGRICMTLTAKLRWPRKNRTHPNRPSKIRKRTCCSTCFWPLKNWFQAQKIFSINRIHSNQNDKRKSKVGRTTLAMELEISQLNGILLLNIPPIPSDRLWISFSDMPEMKFSVEIFLFLIQFQF